mgnify:FL=1
MIDSQYQVNAPDTTLNGNRHNDKTNGAICTNIRLSGGGGVQNRFVGVRAKVTQRSMPQEEFSIYQNCGLTD